MTICVTGSAGFVAGYLIPELLASGHHVIGVDNFSKYGRVEHSFAEDPRYRFVFGDARDADLLQGLARGCDILVCGAARMGGIHYLHRYAYDLLAENERISAAAFDAAIAARRSGRLKKVVVISSSMVFESASEFPTSEGCQLACPPPATTYGFQKLACEYFARGAYEQYGLPYTIVRPFNCVGVGGSRLPDGDGAMSGDGALSGNVALAMSHVLPDLVLKVLRGQDPLPILGSGAQVRHYTYGGDLARGIRLAIEHPAALNEDFNLSTATGTTVLELAEMVWRYLRPATPFRYRSEPPYPHDVQRRVPDVRKARELLGFEAATPLAAVLDEVVPWIECRVRAGRL